jgi:uncharacterized protein (TIGR03067 family)
MSHAESGKKGVWRQIAGIIDGKEVRVGRGVILNVGEQGYAVTVNGRVYQRGTTKNYLDQDPPESDVIVSEGPNAGQICRQIFHIHGDVLVACIAGPGATRPTEFTSRPGSGHILSVWLRATEVDLPQPLKGRTWLMISVLVLLAALAGALSNEVAERWGPTTALLPGTLAGACFFTAVVRALKKSWPYAWTAGMTVSVAGNLFDTVRAGVANSFSAPVAIFLSAATACAAAVLVWALLSRLFKVSQ